MHIADGVLSPVVSIATFGLAAVSIAYGAKDIEEDDIPKIALMSGTFFAVSLIMIPIPPSSVHPLLCGLIGIILGRKSALAFFPALLLQALLFRHGGMTALGANTILLFVPAMISHIVFNKLNMKTFKKGVIAGGLSVIMVVIILVLILVLTDPRFLDDGLSIIKILVLSHLPLVFVEGLITGGAVQFLENTRPNWIARRNV